MNLLQVCSDIHLEMGDIDEIHFSKIIQPSAEILVLAGDIGHPSEPIFDKFIAYCASLFKHVLFISGNHEYYSKTMRETEKCIEQIVNNYSNVIYLNNKTFEYEGIVFVGTTLWSQLPETESMYKLFAVNDFKKIHEYSMEANNLLFKKNLEFLQNNIDKQCIVITHHAPSYKCIPEKYEGDVLNCCYASHLDYLFTNKNIIGWIYGHTHHNYSYYSDDFFLYSNCYRGDNYNICGCPL